MVHRATFQAASSDRRSVIAERLEQRRLLSAVFDSEGFEAPRYTPGPLEDQDVLGPWRKDGPQAGLAQVQTQKVASGAQAVRLNRPAAANGDTRYGVVKPTAPYDDLTVIRISWDMNVTQNAQAGVNFGPFFGVEAYDDASIGKGPTPPLIGSLGVDATTGDVLYQHGTTGVFTETGYSVQLGTWNHFELVLDYDADAYTVYVNGDDKAVTGFVDDPIVGFTDAPLAALAATADTRATASGTAYYDNYRIDIEQQKVDVETAPTVAQVYVSGTQWTQAFKDYLDEKGLGDERYGYAISAQDQLREIPWINVDTISIRFSENVEVDAGDLQIRGMIVPAYDLDPASFTYNPATRTASWRLMGGQRFKNDRIILDLNADGPGGVHDADGDYLDGDWTNPPGPREPGTDHYPSGNGADGGDFRFRIDVLPGDADRNFERVNANDQGYVKARINRSVFSPTSSTPGAASYSVYADVTADGRVNSNDQGAVKARLNTSLPQTELSGAFSSARIRRGDELSVGEALLAR
jgi:hypothetical protein